MSEVSVIAATAAPATEASLCTDLETLGVVPGMVLLCHSSLSQLGWVCGGAVAVIRALEKAIGTGGTLVMPTHSSDLSEPSHWQDPPVPEAWWATIRDEMPAFAADLTPSRAMGQVAECFRKQDGVLRSRHPQVSFAALGPRDALITTDHPLSMGLGEDSPLARIYDLDGWVLLLGVGHDRNTSLHLAESRADFAMRRIEQQGAPIMMNGQRHWMTFDMLEQDTDDFVALGRDFARDTGLVRAGRVGNAETLLIRQRPLVDYAVRWFEHHRH